MGTITSGIGLVSGINSKDIIDQLISIEGRRKDLVQARIDAIGTQKTAYLDVSTRLTGLRINAQSIAKPSFFQAATATSSNEDSLTATASKGAAVGSYQFQVARLVQSQQIISNGFADPAKAPVGAGTLTVEVGGGEVTTTTPLSDLRGGTGVGRGKIRVTDLAGHQTMIDLGDAVTLEDVVKKFNTNVDVNVEAKIVNDRLSITDRSGGLSSELVIGDVGTSTAASDLGIAGNSILGQITGQSLQYLGRDTRLASLNDGNGVANRTGGDLQITLGDGTLTTVDLGSAVTLGEVVDKINTATGTKGTASITPGGKTLRFTDNTGGNPTITGVNGSSTAKDLGLDKAASGGVVDGDAIISRLGTVLLKTLNGGAGVSLGTISIQDRTGAAVQVNLSGAQTLQTAIDVINAAPGSGVKAGINAAGNGIQLVDSTGGTGDIVVSDVSGTGAEQLGIAGTFDATKSVVNGANLQRKWVSESSSLATYNAGKPINSGRFSISLGDDQTLTVAIDATTDLRLGDVVAKINQQLGPLGSAGINAKGDGLLITDATGGTGRIKISDINGSTASDLGIAGTGTSANTLDGSREKTVEITATDTLADVQTKLTALGYGVTASIINDGTPDAPFRLSLNAVDTGRAGRITFDAGDTNLGTRTLVDAQDAAVFVGSADAGNPLLITASRNQISGVIKGVNIELHGVSSSPVTVNVTRDVANVAESLQGFADKFNELVDQIDTYTKFDPQTLERGPLLGDPSISTVQNDLYSMINGVIPQAGRYRILADVGLRVGDGGKLQFDREKFNAAYAKDPESVETLFTNTGQAIAATTRLDLLNKGAGVATAGDGVSDFKATLRDGSNVDVTLGAVATLGQLVSSINGASNSKLRAEITDDGKIKISDLTTGPGPFALQQLNASQALFNLGLSTPAVDGIITGKLLKLDNALNSVTGGVGIQMQQKLGRLIDPVSGVLTQQNKSLDKRTDEYKDRIDDLDKLLANKRARLEKQFSGLESSLSQLQGQQQSLGSLQSLNNSSRQQ